MSCTETAPPAPKWAANNGFPLTPAFSASASSCTFTVSPASVSETVSCATSAPAAAFSATAAVLPRLIEGAWFTLVSSRVNVSGADVSSPSEMVICADMVCVGSSALSYAASLALAGSMRSAPVVGSRTSQSPESWLVI